MKIVLTRDLQEAGSFEFFGITRVHFCLIWSAVVDEQRPLAAIHDHLVLLGLADLLSLSEPSHLCVFSGNFTLQSGGGLLLHSLVLQRLGELYCRLWTHRHRFDQRLQGPLQFK